MMYLIMLLLIAFLTFLVVAFVNAVKKFNLNARLSILKSKIDTNKKGNKRHLKHLLKRKIRVTGSMNIEALKFEYSDIYNLVNEEIKKLQSDSIVTNDMYLIHLHEQFKQMPKSDYKSMDLIYKLACFYKAAIEEPIIVKSDTELKCCNKELIKNVICEVKKEINLEIPKKDYFNYFISCYSKYKSEVWWLCYYIVDKIR